MEGSSDAATSTPTSPAPATTSSPNKTVSSSASGSTSTDRVPTATFNQSKIVKLRLTDAFASGRLPLNAVAKPWTTAQKAQFREKVKASASASPKGNLTKKSKPLVPLPEVSFEEAMAEFRELTTMDVSGKNPDGTPLQAKPKLLQWQPLTENLHEKFAVGTPKEGKSKSATPKSATPGKTGPPNGNPGGYIKASHIKSRMQKMRWDAEADRRLLIWGFGREIVAKEYQGIADTFVEKPTSKAIQERITKLRQENKKVVGDAGILAEGFYDDQEDYDDEGNYVPGRIIESAETETSFLTPSTPSSHRAKKYKLTKDATRHPPAASSSRGPNSLASPQASETSKGPNLIMSRSSFSSPPEGVVRSPYFTSQPPSAAQQSSLITSDRQGMDGLVYAASQAAAKERALKDCARRLDEAEKEQRRVASVNRKRKSPPI